MDRTRLAIYRIAVFVTLVLALVGMDSCSTHKQGNEGKPPRVDASAFMSGRKLKAVQRKMIKEACSWQGTPYMYGGADKGKGTDCSGFVLRVYLDVTGIKLPRNSAAQADFCKSLRQSKVKPCDLVFFATGSDSKRVSHVGMMLDEENFIHASSSKGVIVTRLDNPWWNKRILKFGRVPGFR